MQQLVLDRINIIRPQLPAGCERDARDRTPAAWGGSTSTRWSIAKGSHDLRELRLVNESQIKPALQTVPGVAEVASVGGLEKQYQLKIFPPLLARAGISLKQLIGAVQSVFQEAGGRMIEVTNRDYQLRGVDQQRRRRTSWSFSSSAGGRTERPST